MKLTLLWLLLGLASLAAAAEGPRLALLADPSARTEADLLTVELSRQPIQLLERAEIDRVLAEQKLTLANLAPGQLAVVGRELKADGVIFLAESGSEKKRTLALRGVAVHPGVVIASWREEVPTDAAAWSREAGARLAALLPKFAVSADVAVPVSVLNLRVTRTRPEAAEIERELTVLLTHRLAHEPALFVLEREQMAALAEEKTEDAAPFWTGRWLIDGAIELSPGDPEALTITARLHPPGGGDAATVTHQCRRDELAAAAGTLAEGIARALKQEPLRAAWDAGLEAEQFWREAQWAFRNSLYSPAERAAEVSWALGRRPAETMAMRVRSILLAAHSQELIDIPLPADAVGSYFFAHEQHWSYESGRSRNPQAWRRVYQKMPGSEREERLRGTLRGVELARDHAVLLRGDAALFQLTLVTGGALLDWLADSRDGVFDEGMLALRSALRELVALAPAGPHRVDEEAVWRRLRVNFAPVLAETPAETIAVFRQALGQRIDAGRDGQMRLTLAHARDRNPELVAERRAATPGAIRLWKGLLDDLAASDFVGDRLFSLYGQTALAAPQGKGAPIKELLDGFWQERARWVKDELSFDYIKLLDLPRFSYVATFRDVSPVSASDPEGKREFARRLLLYLIDNRPFLGSYVFGELYHPDLYTEEEAREVYQALLRYDDRFRPKFGERDTLRIIRERSEELLLRFPALRPPSAEPALKVTRFWHPYRTPGLDPSLSHAGVHITAAFYGEGRLWFHARFDQAGSKKSYEEQPYYVYSVALNTFEIETIFCPGNPVPSGPHKSVAESNPVLVTPEAVFAMHAMQLSRYDRSAHTWRFYPQLVNLFAQPLRVGDRLYLRSDNSSRSDWGRLMGDLTELNLTTGAVTLIASDRRHPPESPLDSWPLCELAAQASPEGGVNFRGTPRESAAAKLFASYDPAARQWSPLVEPQWVKADSPQPEEWKLLGRANASGPFSLARGKVKIPFECELTAADRTALTRNGPFPKIEVIERLMPGMSVIPYHRTTPEGVIIFGANSAPGFWFIPNADLEAAAKKAAPAPAKRPAAASGPSAGE